MRMLMFLVAALGVLAGTATSPSSCCPDNSLQDRARLSLLSGVGWWTKHWATITTPLSG